MSKTIQVSVTQSDIDAAHKSTGFRCCECPIARAIRRYYPEATVTGENARLAHHGTTVAMPLTAQTFIRAFDAGEPVQPIEFEIEVPA